MRLLPVAASADGGGPALFSTRCSNGIVLDTMVRKAVWVLQQVACKRQPLPERPSGTHSTPPVHRHHSDDTGSRENHFKTNATQLGATYAEQLAGSAPTEAGQCPAGSIRGTRALVQAMP